MEVLLLLFILWVFYRLGFSAGYVKGRRDRWFW